MGALRDKIVSSAGLRLGSRAFRILVDFSLQVVLARLLSPDDFGVAAIAFVVSYFLATVGSGGLVTALVQREKLSDDHFDSSFWVLLGLYLLLGLAAAVSGPFVAAFYGDPIIAHALAFLALQFPVQGLGCVPLARLQRSLQFDTLAKIEFLAIPVSAAVSLGLALSGAGLWALLARPFVLQLVMTLGLVAAARWRPHLRFSASAFQELVPFSWRAFADELLIFGSRSLDTVVVGRVLGTSDLGLYNRAYTVVVLPGHGSEVVARVFFGAFSRMQSDKERISRIFFAVTGFFALVFIPAFAGLAVVADLAVIFVFGEKWREMVLPLRLLCPAGLMWSLGSLRSSVFLAVGRADLKLRYTLLGSGATLTGIVGGLYWGIGGVALGVTIGSIVDVCAGSHRAARLVDAGFASLARSVGPACLGAAIMVGTMLAVRSAIAERIDQSLLLVTLLFVGAVVYGSFVLTVTPSAYRGALEVFNPSLYSTSKGP